MKTTSVLPMHDTAARLRGCCFSCEQLMCKRGRGHSEVLLTKKVK